MPIRSFDQSEIVLSERRRLEIPLLLAVWAGVVGFSLAAGSWFYIFAGTLGVGVNLLAVRRNQEVYIQRVFVNVGVLAATAIMLLELVRTADPLIVKLGHYLILIQLCKLFERKRNRDYVQLLALSVLLMVAGAMISTSIWYAAAVVVQIVLACHTAMVFTLKRGLDAAGATRLATETAPVNPRLVAWNVIRDWPGRAIRGRLGVILVAIFATGALMFLVTPRVVWGGLEPMPEVDAVGASAFRNSLSLSDAGRIYQSNAIMMTVTVRSQDESLAPPALQYFRCRTYDRYAQSVWSASHGVGGTPLPRELPPDSVVQDVAMEPALLPALFAAYPPVRCASPYGSPQWNVDLTISLMVHPPPTGTVRYTVWSWRHPLTAEQLSYLRSTGGAPLGDPAEHVEVPRAVADLARAWCGRLKDERERLLEPIVRLSDICRPPRFLETLYEPLAPRTQAERWLRALHARRAALATGGERDRLDGRIARLQHVCMAPSTTELLDRAGRWLAELEARRDDLARDIANELARRLRSEYDYTLDVPRPPSGTDALEHFLLTARKGHCTLFASALAVMCRSLGVHARVATGFRVDSPEAGGRQYVARGRDAHAWTEVYTPSSHWVIVDATPAGRGQPSPPWWAPLRDFWQRVQFFWKHRVVGYDEVARRNLGRWFRGAWQAVSGAFARAARAVRDAFVNMLVHGQVDVAVAYLSLAVSLLGTGVLVALALRAVRRKVRFRRAVREGHAVPWWQLRFFVRLVSLLERRGANRRPDQTPREFVRHATETLHLPADALGRLVDLYYRVRWGRRPAAAEEVRAADAQVAEIARRLKRRRR